jgi:hypothetical protein
MNCSFCAEAVVAAVTIAASARPLRTARNAFMLLLLLMEKSSPL